MLIRPFQGVGSALLATASILGLLAVTEVQAATVYVGYADNLRSTTFFPTPWLGDPGVVSDASPAQAFDAGAVRIENTSAAPITISNMAVVMNGGSGPTFTLWGPLVIPAGGNGIFTQSVAFDFDTSDFGGFGGLPPASLAPNLPGNNAIGGCSSPAAILGPSGYAADCAANAPIVLFLEDGNPVTLVDTGHILDTGWWDFTNNGFFGGDSNESIKWNVIGTVPTRDGDIPEPVGMGLLALGLFGLTRLGRSRAVR